MPKTLAPLAVFFVGFAATRRLNRRPRSAKSNCSTPFVCRSASRSTRLPWAVSRGSPTTERPTASGWCPTTAAQRAPARLLRLRLAIADGRLTADDVEFEAALFLRDQNGAPFARRSLDPEAVALSSNGFFVSSEGESKAGVPPFVAEFDREGKMRRRAELPARYLPAGDGTRGVRDNLGFEALSTTEDRATLLFATEGPLVGDGPAADVDTTGVARIRRVDVPTGGAEGFLSSGRGLGGAHAAQWLPGQRPLHLLALDRNRFLALEWSSSSARVTEFGCSSWT